MTILPCKLSLPVPRTINGEGWTYLVSETSGGAELGKVTTPVEHFTIFAILAEVSRPVIIKPDTIEPIIEEEQIVVPPPLTPATFKLSNLTITPYEPKIFPAVSYFIKTGETATISVDVTNDGQENGVYSATLKVNDRDIETKQVTLSSGETRTISFTFEADEQGHYSVQIGSLNGDLYYDLWINWWLCVGSIGLFLLLLWSTRKYWLYP